MNVELKEMHLRNFKGVADATFAFSHNTLVRGTNGTGKTTLNDAFTFCLFGKDSRGRSDFDFKRRDANHQQIHELEYAVEVTLLVDSTERRFERVMVEKWTKPRGAKEKYLSGHEFAYYIDRVRCATKKEFDSAVSSIASEEMMRMMTDPMFFMSQKDDVKKATLLRLAYGTSDQKEAAKIASQEVLESHSEFADFVMLLGNSQAEDYNKLVESKIRAIKEEIGSIPMKIAAKKETIPQEEDWEAIAVLIKEQKEEIDKIDKQIADVNARHAGVTRRANEIKAQISNVSLELITAENEIRAKVNATNMSQMSTINSLDNEARIENDTKNRLMSQLNEDSARLKAMTEKLNAMRSVYKSIKDGSYQFCESEMCCPTCHRPYDMANIVDAKLKENVAQGKAMKAEYDRIYQEYEIVRKKIGELDAKIASISEKRAAITYKPIEATKAIQGDDKCQKLRSQIDNLKSQLSNAPTSVEDTSEIEAIKREAQSKVDLWNSQLGTRDLIAQIKKQVDELEKRQKALNKELGELEKMQDVAHEFMKAKDDALMKRINSLFTIVSWDFVSEQLNGGEKLCCNCYVDGMPYNEKNRAGQINAGLDIINALCMNEGICLPIFFDNAESVVEYIATESQKVMLAVDSTCSQLTFQAL